MSKPKKPRESSNPYKNAGGKTPKAEHNVTPKKSPSVARELPDRVASRPIQFTFRLMDHDGPWSFDKITAEDSQQLFRFLGNIETQTVGELAAGTETGLYKEYDMGDCPNPEPLRRLGELYEGADAICRLRVDGKKRLYGIKQDHVFAVLWWDPEHEVWPSNRNR